MLVFHEKSHAGSTKSTVTKSRIAPKNVLTKVKCSKGQI